MKPLEVFYKKGVLENLAKFTENACVGVPFLIKLRPETFIKKRNSHTGIFL